MNNPESGSFSQRMTRIAACGVFIATSFLAGDRAPEPHVAIPEVPTAEIPPIITEEDCPAPSEQALAEVNRLFDPKAKEDRFAHTRSKREYREKVAALQQEFGIVFPSYDWKVLSDLEVGLSQPDQQAPFEDYLSTANSILMQSNAEIKVGLPEYSDYKADIPTPAELESNGAKAQVFNLAKMYTKLPLSITKNMGVKGFYLTARAEGIMGLAYNEHGDALIDIINTPADDYEVIDHEAFHLFDALYCGPERMHNDPGFTALNAESEYANEWPLPDGFKMTQPKTFEDISNKYYKISEKMYKAIPVKNKAIYCKSKTELKELGADVEQMEDYDFYNVVEGKADIGRQIFDAAFYSSALDENMPIRRDKFIYLLARFYEKFPNEVHYYSYFAPKYRPEEIKC